MGTGAVSSSARKAAGSATKLAIIDFVEIAAGVRDAAAVLSDSVKFCKSAGNDEVVGE